ncbi:hypothetical protein FSB08_25125 [Paraburkholderia sp. JPY432]|uniref:TnsD family Tn7-like transposition protein n=1 Tax=Paraburkholderia youngii TaxID=2782701 RepID=UPI001595DF56|nr:hypothetical protein [Paraburkholderia youngii]
MMAISLFPLNEGETLDSNIARYAEWMGLTSSDGLRRRLFGYPCRVGTRFPLGISRLASQTRDYWGLTADQIISRNTELNYFIRMGSPALHSSVCAMMRNPHSGGVLRINPQRAERVSRFRYCDECLAEWDRAGVAPYWKISHQLPGAYYCDIHLSPLRVVTGELPTGAMEDTSLQRIMHMQSSVVLQEVTAAEACAIKDVAIKSARQLADGSTSELSHYLNLVRDAGFLTSDGRLKMADLVANWLAFFGPTYCYLASLDEQKISAWWKLVSGVTKANLPHPFIFITAETLLESLASCSTTHLPSISQSPVELSLSRLPRCSGSLHRDCDSYGAARRVRRSRRWVVECTCGITYNVCANPADVDVRMRASAYGERYKEHFYLLLGTRGNYKLVAQEIGISRIVARSWNREKTLLELSETKKNTELHQREKDILRREWRKLVRAAPSERRITAARLAGKAIYERLALYDHEWLINFNRARKTPRIGKTHCSKNQLTEARLQKVYQAYDDLIRAEPPVRVTGATILRRVGFPAPVRDNKDWSRLLIQLGESSSAYFVRVRSWLLDLPMSRRPRNMKEFRQLTHRSWHGLTAEQKNVVRSCFSSVESDDRHVR